VSKSAEQEVHHGIVEPNVLALYPTNETRIAELGKQYTGLSFDTPENYETGRKAIANLRDLRVAIGKTHDELKAPVLERGRLIDSTANRLVALVEQIEKPLQLAKGVVDEAKAKAKKEREEAEKAAIAAKIKAEREEEDAT
jgi:hypothetical protein